MDYTSLLHLLSTLSWNISSDVEDNNVPICSNTNQTFNKTFFIYHDGFSQKHLKQHNCSCDIYSNGANIEIQHLTLINKENTSLVLNKGRNSENFKDQSTFIPSEEIRSSYRLQHNGTVHFTENGGISQFVITVSNTKKTVGSDITLICNNKTSEITHPGLMEEENSTINNQLASPVSNKNDNNDTNSASMTIGMILTGIGICMIFSSILIIFIFRRKYSQKKDIPEKVINTHTVSEIIPEKTSDIKITQVSESNPVQEDYEFCEIPEYYTISKETPETTIPNLPSKPPPTKQDSVDFTKSSVTDDRKSNTSQIETSNPLTEGYSNFQLESQPIQRETINEKSENNSERYSNCPVHVHSHNKSVLPENGQNDYDNLDDIEDTYNHLENVLCPQTSLNKSFANESPNGSTDLHFDNKGCFVKNGEIFGNLEIKMLDNCENSEVKDKTKQDVKDQAGHKSSNKDDAGLKRYSDSKLFKNSRKGDFDNVVHELVQKSKSCSSTIDYGSQEMIIIENELYESMDG